MRKKYTKNIKTEVIRPEKKMPGWLPYFGNVPGISLMLYLTYSEAYTVNKIHHRTQFWTSLLKIKMVKLSQIFITNP